jgi:hypothetical protein
MLWGALVEAGLAPCHCRPRPALRTLARRWLAGELEAETLDYESAEGGNSDRDAPVTAENFTPVAGALLVAVYRSRRLFTDRTRTVAGSRAHATTRGCQRSPEVRARPRTSPQLPRVVPSSSSASPRDGMVAAEYTDVAHRQLPLVDAVVTEGRRAGRRAGQTAGGQFALLNTDIADAARGTRTPTGRTLADFKRALPAPPEAGGTHERGRHEPDAAHGVTALVKHPEPTREPGVDPDHPSAVSVIESVPKGHSLL